VPSVCSSPQKHADVGVFVLVLADGREDDSRARAVSARHRQPSDNLIRHGIRPCRDLLRRLVLYGMLHVNGVKARATQRAGLHSRRSGEFSCGDGHCRDTKIF
jgi:hypothetical protein